MRIARLLPPLALAVALPLVPRAFAQPPGPAPGPISPDPVPRDWSGHTPVRYPDPDVIRTDSSGYRAPNARS